MRKPVKPRRVRRHEEHTSHEAWAIPYADLLTLLLAFFVVMYAISSVNAGKYRVLSDSLFAAFRGAPRTMSPVQVGEKQVGSGADIQTSIVQQAMLEGQPRSLLAVKVDPGTSSRTSGNPAVTPHPPARNEAALAASRALQHVADQVEQAMSDLINANLVAVRRSDFWIEVEIRTDILFPSGSAHLHPNATGVIERLAASLASLPNPVRVEGYTDNLPIRNTQFYSNWELSAARAGSVVRVLSGHGVEPSRLAVIGYGEQRPVQPNDTPQGRNANRRVVIVILSTQIKRTTEDAPDAPSFDLAGAAAAHASGQVSAQENTPVAPEAPPPPVAPLATAPPEQTTRLVQPAAPIVTSASRPGPSPSDTPAVLTSAPQPRPPTASATSAAPAASAGGMVRAPLSQ